MLGFACVSAVAWCIACADVVTRRLQTDLPPRPVAGKVPETWVPAVSAHPGIDGSLSDPVWSEARPLLLRELTHPRVATPRTEVRCVRCGNVLYVAFTLSEPNVGALRRKATQHDGPAWQDDSVELFLSPRPRGGYYQIVVGAAGAVFDRIGHGDPGAWNCSARAAVGFGRSQWWVEVAIPLTSLGVSGTPPSRWRANFYRNRYAGAKGAHHAWSPTFCEDYDVPERFGVLFFTAHPPKKPLETKAAGKPGIEITQLRDGQVRISLDVSFLRPGTRIYRAVLYCVRDPLLSPDPEALAPIVIVPELSAEGNLGNSSEGRARARPLSLAPPDFRTFEMTELLRAYLALLGKSRSSGAHVQAGDRKIHLRVKSFPGFRPEKTSFEVRYEGRATGVPPQPRGLEVFHRAGQTFITWKEVDPLIMKREATWGEIKAACAVAEDTCRYRIYTHTLQINAKTIASATLLAEVGPLSGFNVNSRNVEYLIGQALLKPDQMGELARDYNGYMYTWHMDHPRMDRYPVPCFVIDPGQGPLAPGVGLFVHNPKHPGSRYYAVLSVQKGIENAVDFSPQNSLSHPVREGVGPGDPVLQGPGLWGPYFDYPGRRQVYVQWCSPPLSPAPGMAFNWSVLLPPGIPAGTRVPAELHLHSGNFSYAKPPKKYLRMSIQIAPHDWPPSGWYGFHDAYGTLRSWKEGAVRNHTHRRIFAFLRWAEKKWPIDPDRIILTGSDGAALLALHARSRFAYVLIQGFGGKASPVGSLFDPSLSRALVAAWGPQSPLIRDELGRTEWGWAKLDALAAERPGESTPLFLCQGPSWGGVRRYAKAFGPFYRRMQQAGQPLIAGFGWDTKLVKPERWTGLWGPRRHLQMEPLDLTRRTPISAFADSSRSQETEQWGNINYFHAWKDLVDEPERFHVTLYGQGTVDLTPRRLQNFRPKAGERLNWKAGEQSGRVTVDANGVFTLKGLTIPKEGLLVTIRRKGGGP